MSLDDYPLIAFIGGGNMANALLGGAVAAGIPTSCLRVAEPDALKRAGLARSYGITTTEDNADAAQGASLVVLAVKPQVAANACQEIKGALAGSATILSVMAGVRIQTLDNWLGGNRSIVRAMPNTPALIGRGITTLHAAPGLDSSTLQRVEWLFSGVGETLWVDDEAALDPATAVAGSGPAYLFLLAEALSAAGVAAGLDARTSDRLARVTLRGAAEMTLLEATELAALRQQVTSPGGTTAAAIAVLEQGGFRGLVQQAVVVATDRAREIGISFDPDHP